jgi:hypothetical protein
MSEIAPFHLDHIPLAAAGCPDDALVEDGRNLGRVSLRLPSGIVCTLDVGPRSGNSLRE